MLNPICNGCAAPVQNCIFTPYSPPNRYSENIVDKKLTIRKTWDRYTDEIKDKQIHAFLSSPLAKEILTEKFLTTIRQKNTIDTILCDGPILKKEDPELEYLIKNFLLKKCRRGNVPKAIELKYIGAPLTRENLIELHIPNSDGDFPTWFTYPHTNGILHNLHIIFTQRQKPHIESYIKIGPRHILNGVSENYLSGDVLDNVFKSNMFIHTAEDEFIHPVYLAVLLNDTVFLKKLLQSGFNPNALSNPKHWNTLFTQLAFTKKLLENRLHIKARFDNQELAILFKDEAFSKKLIEAGIYSGAITYPRYWDYLLTQPIFIETVLKIKLGIKINYLIRESVLHFALKNNMFSIAKMLLEHGASLRTLLDNGAELVYIAASNMQEDALKKLLKLGLNANGKNAADHNKSALHYAVRQNSLPMTVALLEHGAEVNAQDNFKQTALNFAVWINRIDLIDILLQFGADPHLGNTLHGNALDIAIEKYKSNEIDNISTIKTLLEHGAARSLISLSVYNIANTITKASSLIRIEATTPAQANQNIKAPSVHDNSVNHAEEVKNTHILMLLWKNIIGLIMHFLAYISTKCKESRTPKSNTNISRAFCV